jgi:ubiquinone/menaquinone biosynthesis C-methylase UbiE
MKDFIKEVWNSQAEKHQDSHWASWGDKYAISLEIEEVRQYISDNMLILDVGCANGFAAFKHLESNPTIKIEGIDFSENMITAANNKILNSNTITGNINFSVGDVRKINFPSNTFDLVYTTRVIINLPNWDEQMQGILECIRVAKKGGIIIISEAFWEPLVKLNALRTIMGLNSLIEHDFNRYLKKSRLFPFLNKEKLQYEVHDFSSVYYLGSRLLRELVTDYKNYEGYENPINEIFYSIEKEFSGGDIGIQQAVIIRK